MFKVSTMIICSASGFDRLNIYQYVRQYTFVKHPEHIQELSIPEQPHGIYYYHFSLHQTAYFLNQTPVCQPQPMPVTTTMFFFDLY
jgi:hypothetical protein